MKLKWQESLGKISLLSRALNPTPIKGNSSNQSQVERNWLSWGFQPGVNLWSWNIIRTVARQPCCAWANCSPSHITTRTTTLTVLGPGGLAAGKNAKKNTKLIPVCTDETFLALPPPPPPPSCSFPNSLCSPPPSSSSSSSSSFSAAAAAAAAVV